MATAIFAMGCFWKPELLFRKIDGVNDAEVGYSNGHTDNPTYKQVCSGNTGHAEVVKVTFDKNKISYDELLNVFWNNHNPTTLNRQGPDTGSQYRSGIYTSSDEQMQQALASKREKQAELDQEIVTEIQPVEKYTTAEDYHQQYLERNRGAVC